MKRFVFVFGTLLLLTGCVKSGSVSYQLRFSDPALKNELSPAALRAVQGRLYALKQDAGAKSAVLDSSGSIISIILKSDVADELTKQLTAPLNFSVMTQVPAAQAEITVEKLGALKGSGITEKDVSKTVVNPTSKDGTSSATISFTPQGAALLKKVCADNLGKVIALTVRHHLVSTFTVGSSDCKHGSVTVSGAPNAAMAQAFTDDMNVGTHVTFIPLTSSQ